MTGKTRADHDTPSSGAARRAVQVADVFGRHGVSAELHALGLAGRNDRVHRVAVRSRHLRDAFVELGPTFIKLGQFLSTRPDLLHPDLVAELETLQDDVPPVAGVEIERVVERSLQQPLRQLFSSFDVEPLAAASIAQVHAAVLLDGSPVVLKVRRPGIEATIAADLALLHRLAQTIEHRRGQLGGTEPRAIVEELGRSLHRELDFEAEGRAADSVRTTLGGHPRVHVPIVHWPLTTKEVLTLERVTGVRLDRIDVSPADGSALARDLVDAVLTMVFVAGEFHADLHPGNVLLEADGRVALVDFGMMGYLTELGRSAIGQLLSGVVRHDPQVILIGLGDLGVAVDQASPGLESDVLALLDCYRELPLAELVVGKLLEDLAAVARRHTLRLPPDLLLLIKTVAQCESLAVRLDPGFQLLPSLAACAMRLALPATGS